MNEIQVHLKISELKMRADFIAEIIQRQGPFTMGENVELYRALSDIVDKLDVIVERIR